MFTNPKGCWLALAVGVVLAAAAPASAQASTQTSNPWQVIAAPGSTTDQQLLAVSADSASDAWAVGGNTEFGGPVVDHWNGHAWSVSLSNSSGPTLFGVAAISPSNVWAVGESPSDDGQIEHWNGSAWSKMNLNGRYGNGPLYGISALSATDIWVVDEFSNIYHYNGTGWRLVYKSPASLYSHQQTPKIVALSDTDVWVSTVQTDTFDSNYRAYAINWNGATGTNYKLPESKYSDPYDIAASDPKHVWIAGVSGAGLSNENPYATMWNGARWVYHPPPYTTTLREMDAIAVVSPTQVWGVGDRNVYQYVLQDEWTGSGWARQSGGPDPGTGRNALLGAARIPGTSQVWAVGFQATDRGPGQDSPLIEHCCTS